ncbi:MAG: hypothetical protein GXY82_00355 [Methanospirillum sp.]|nr:hypothetical protein [Methanospirillum sp.]
MSAMVDGRSVTQAEDGVEGDRRPGGPCHFAPSPPHPSLPSRLCGFHERLPLAGDPPNALLSLPDDRLL